MDKTTNIDVFRDVFQSSLKINARSISVKTLLSERNVKRINYSPYYQRNYVWDKEKQTFFIESVVMGTEIPPLILFKTGTSIEVIDGRQRFETLKKFKENKLSLSANGLKELGFLKRLTFNKLSDETRDIFLESNIRIFEFEVVNQPNLSEEIIDRVKKEIFRRYNTGITALTRNELDNAKYDEDEFSDKFKGRFKSDFKFFKKFSDCFTVKDVDKDSDGVIAKNVDLIRRFRILNKFPISTYAGSSKRGEITDLLYDFSNNESNDITLEYNRMSLIIDRVLGIYEKFSNIPNLDNRLIYECIVWAISVLDSEDVDSKIDEDRLKVFLIDNIEEYSLENSHYYANIIRRYEATSKFFFSGLEDELSVFIRDSNFSKRLKDLAKTEAESNKTIESHEALRLHKPNPTSVPIDEIKSDLKTSRYLLRPSYQRQEKISQSKASSIIESILLGINLPPIFIYKRESGIKEVVDGQQRLLSIIGFLGEEFHNESGKPARSVNNNFKLKGLRVLTDLEGKVYSELEDYLQDRILDFVLDQIVIVENMNKEFDPIDLFIRLNYKPYPIKPNSFEMWNSIVDQDVVVSIKDIAKSNNASWFFLREIKEGKSDRMLNEELIVTLSYILYNKSREDVVGFFLRQDNITCRIKSKTGLSDFLINLDNTAIEKKLFIEAIYRTKDIIDNLSRLFKAEISKEIFNDFLNVKSNKTFRRTLQDFYVIWLLLMHVDESYIDKHNEEILMDIKSVLCMLRNTEGKVIDEDYFGQFNKLLSDVQDRWKKSEILI